MAAKAGRLQVQMEMDIAQIKRDISQMTTEVKRASTQWKSDLDNFATGFKQGVIGALTGGAITAALSSLVSTALGKFDEIADGAKKIGTSAEGFQELSYVAAQTGTDIDSVSAAVVKLEKNLADVGAGGGKNAAAALNTIGIALDDLKGKAPDEAFRKIIDGLSKVEDPAKRAQAGMALFGKGFSELGPMVAEGTESIDSLIQRAHDLGIVLSDEAVQAGEAFNDQLDTMRLTITGLVGNAIGPMLPLLTEMIGEMLNVATATDGADTEMASFGGTMKEVAKAMVVLVGAARTVGTAFTWLGQTIGTAIGGAIDKLGAFDAAFKQAAENARNPFSTDRKNPIDVFTERVAAANQTLKDQYAQIDANASAAFASIGDSLGTAMANIDKFKAEAAEPIKAGLLSDALDDDTAATEKNTKAKKANKEAREQLSDAEKAYQKDLEEIWKLTADIEAEQMKANGASERDAELYRLRAQGASELAIQVWDLQKQFDSLADINDRNKQAAEDYKNAMIDLTAEQMRANGSTEDAIRLYRQQAEGMTELEKKADNAKQEVADAAEANRKRAQESADLSQTIESGINDIFTSLSDGAKSATDAVKRLLLQLVALWAQQKIMGFFNFGGTAAANGAAFAGSGVRMFAQGGIVSSPTPFTFNGGNYGVMGEAGPEAILPLTRGANGKLGVQGGGVSVNVHNYAGSSIETQTDGDNLNIIVKRVKDSLSTDVLRGGNSYATAMERTYGLRR